MEKWIENAAYHVEREFAGGRIYPGDRDRVAASIAHHAPAWLDAPTHAGDWILVDREGGRFIIHILHDSTVDAHARGQPGGRWFPIPVDAARQPTQSTSIL